MALSRDHHVVPQFYLRRFADDRRRVRQMTRADREGTLVPVRRATVEMDLYNIVDKHGALNDGWEKVLSFIETRAAPVVAAILKGTWPLDDSPRERLAIWLAAQYVRTPRFRLLLDIDFEDMRARVSAGGVPAIRAIADHPELPDDALLAAWAKAEALYPRNSYQTANTQLGWFESLLEETVKELYERAWVLTQFDEPALLSADNALVPLSDGPGAHPLAAGAAAVFDIALDRQHLLQLVKSWDRRDRRGQPSAEVAFMANAVAVGHAHRYVYEHPDDRFARTLWDIPDEDP